jgi:chromosomal replication initiation ATPase DnaA
VTVAQLTLDLPHRTALDAEDFLVSDCNRAAVKLIDAWPEWPDQAPPRAARRIWRAYGKRDREPRP